MEVALRRPCLIRVVEMKTEVEEVSIQRQSGCKELEEEELTTDSSTYLWIVRGSRGLRGSHLHLVEDVQAGLECVWKIFKITNNSHFNFIL